MSNFAPLTDIRPDDAAPGTQGAATPTAALPPYKNYADDPAMVSAVRQDIYPLFTHIKSSRQTLQEQWLSVLRMEQQTHDGNRSYVGRSNKYLPLWARIHKTQVSMLSNGLFPSGEYLDVEDLDGNTQHARANKTYLQWEFEANGKVRQRLKPALKQLSSFGTMVLKYDYKKRRDSSRRQGRAVLGLDGKKTFNFKDIGDYEGLSVSARSLFNFYVYPTTANDLQEATLIAEEIPVPRMTLMEMHRQGVWKNVEQALAARTQSAEFDAAKQAQQPHLHDSYLMNQSNTPQGDVLVLVEIWTFMRLPRSAYAADEDPNVPVSCRILLAGDVPLEIQRNPYFHQRAPYVTHSMDRHPGQFYGNGVGKMVAPLQYLANDFANQTNDVGQYVLNPIAKINPGMLAGPLKPLAPGVTWYLTDVKNGAEFDRPPVELVQYGIEFVQMYMGMAQDLGGAPPILQGARKSGGTATGDSILQNNVMIPFQDLVEDVELEIMLPMMFGAWVNAQQFRSEEVMAYVAQSQESLKVLPEQLVINPRFKWLASQQSVNRMQRSQQATQLLQALVPMAPYFNQLGYILDPVPLVERIFSDGMGFRGFENVLRKAQAVPGMMQPGMPVPPGVQQEQGDRVYSAMETIGGRQGMDMAPGEGEGFAEVRQGANDLAATLGQLGGGL